MAVISQVEPVSCRLGSLMGSRMQRISEKKFAGIFNGLCKEFFIVFPDGFKDVET